MIVRKAGIFLIIMTTVGHFMPLPSNWENKKTKSTTRFGKVCGHGRKIYVQVYLIWLGIMIASDLRVYQGIKIMHLNNFANLIKSWFTEIFYVFFMQESNSSIDLRLCMGMSHLSALLWTVAVICGEVPIMENSRHLEHLCALDIALDSVF